MIIIKRFIKFILPLFTLILMSASAYAYNVVNLPESMSLSDAFGIFDAEEITRITVSDPSDGQYITLTDSEIDDFYNTVRDMPAYRVINPTPFRGIAINVYTNGGEKCYYLNSGVQIGLYGSENYICYKLGKEDTEKLLYLDSNFKDAKEKSSGETIHRETANDFLKMPQAQWAQSFAREAASKSLIPYEFTSIYSNNITREQFCVLLGNMIAVKENYISIERYMLDRGTPYLKNTFEDCAGIDSSVDILYALGIVNGRDETHFDPYGSITREEAATLLCKVAEMYIWIGTETELKYDDTASISSWAKFFVTWANEYGIMTGITETEFAPQGEYTVEQAIATVVRLFNLLS